jgi:hypothetical protein
MIAEDRPLSVDERRVGEHLLRHAGVPGAADFIAQLDQAKVTGRCPCGCPTVDLRVPAEFRVRNPPKDRLIADARGRTDGKVMGAMIFQDDGLLSLFEVYRLEDFSDSPFSLPAVETIERFD